MKSYLSLFLIIPLSLIFSLNAFSQDKKKGVKKPPPFKDKVLATVNGEKVMYSAFLAHYLQSMKVVTNKPITMERILNEIIDRKINLQRAKKAKLDKNPTVKDKMENVLYHAQVSKDLEPLLKKIEITDKDVENYYKNHKEYRTAHILLKVRIQPQKEETEEALKLSTRIYNDLKKQPNRFAEYANQFSQSSTAENGGDMGWQMAIRYAPEYYRAIKGKGPGYISPPVRTQFGYHVIKVLGVKNFKEIELPVYKKLVYNTKRDKILEKFFEDQRKKAKIKINKKLLKGGASK